jgi:hypothetical protein
MRPGGGQQNSVGSSDERNPLPSISGPLPSRRPTFGGGGAPSSSRISSSVEESSGRYSSNVLSSSNQHLLSALGRGTPKGSSGKVSKQINLQILFNMEGRSYNLTSPTPPCEYLHSSLLDLQECRQESLLHSVFQFEIIFMLNFLFQFCR